MSVEDYRDTMHDYSINDIVAIALSLGFDAEARVRSERGPDVVLKLDDMIIFVESEVGHCIGGAGRYYERIIRRISNFSGGIDPENTRLFLIIITNTPRRLVNNLGHYRGEFRRLGFRYADRGKDIFIVPALLYKELLPAILVKIMVSSG